jgi:hypothetical protein
MWPWGANGTGGGGICPPQGIILNSNTKSRITLNFFFYPEYSRIIGKNWLKRLKRESKSSGFGKRASLWKQSWRGPGILQPIARRRVGGGAMPAPDFQCIWNMPRTVHSVQCNYGTLTWHLSQTNRKIYLCCLRQNKWNTEQGGRKCNVLYTLRCP